MKRLMSHALALALCLDLQLPAYRLLRERLQPAS